MMILDALPLRMGNYFFCYGHFEFSVFPGRLSNINNNYIRQLIPYESISYSESLTILSIELVNQSPSGKCNCFK